MPQVKWDKPAKPKVSWDTQNPDPNAITTDQGLASARVDTLGREVSSLGHSIAGIPSAMYHAYSDPATPEEKSSLTDSMGPPNKFDLATNRMIIKPISTAYDWYKQAAQGKVPDVGDQVLSVLPEAIGAGASAPIVGKIAETAPKAISEVATVKNAAAPIRMMARGAEATGKLPVVGPTLKAVGTGLRNARYINTPVDEIPAFRMPGRDLGLPKPPQPVYPGAPFPEPASAALGRVGVPPRPIPLEQASAIGTAKPVTAFKGKPIYRGAPLPIAPPAEAALSRLPATGAQSGLSLEQAQTLKSGAQSAPAIPTEAAERAPLRPIVFSSPEEAAAYDAQMSRLKSEAHDTGMYSAARGKVGKKVNYQERALKDYKK